VIQEMFAVGLGLQGIAQLVDSPQAEATLVDAVDRLDRAVETLRRHIFELKQEPEMGLGLDDRLQETVARMGSAYPVTVRLSLDLEATVDARLEDEVVSIVTESLSNSLRHASADNVDVAVLVDDDHVEIRVTDDGVGFDPATPTVGMGLENLRARVSRRGGRLTIESSPGGTELSVMMPVSSPAG
jgi:signal transduction histidine kinase